MTIQSSLRFVVAMGVVSFSYQMAYGQDRATAMLKDQKGASVGSVEFLESDKGVLLRLNLKAVPAGERAFHIHETGKCDPPFKSAGSHFNPGKHNHGKGLSPEAHAGDMPNLNIPGNGELFVEIVNPAITLAKGKPNSLFHDGGTSVVIHASRDDYKTDPDGAAGDRIACGVIEAK